GGVFSGCARCSGSVRSLLNLPATGERADAGAAGTADRGPSLLHLLVDLLLYGPLGSAFERALQQSGLRFVCAGRAGCFHQRLGIPADLAEKRAVLSGGG